MKKRHILTFFAIVLCMTGFGQDSIQYYSYDGNLLNDYPVLRGKETRLIFTPSNIAIIIIPVGEVVTDTSFLCCWAHIEKSGDTIILNSSTRSKAISDKYFRYECDTSIDFHSVIPMLFPEFILPAYNVDFISYNIYNLQFIIKENRIIPTNE